MTKKASSFEWCFALPWSAPQPVGYSSPARLSTVIPACRESGFIKTKKDSGEAGMTDLKHKDRLLF
jgi:hypothetical protein